MLPIKVHTYDADENCETRITDLGTHDGRVWLSKHILWCVQNDRVVEIEKVEIS